MDINKKLHHWITLLFPRLHYLLVKREPMILNAFDSWVALHPILHEQFKIISYFVVLKINIQFFIRKIFCAWKPSFNSTESAISLLDFEKTVSELEKYDVISFDVFDTLLLRPFSSPQAIFGLVGEKLGIPGFHGLRQKVQEQLIKLHEKNGQDYTLNDIYNILAEKLGISATDGAEQEKQLELTFSIPNPYLLLVFQRLKKSGKKIVALSDMYLSSNDISNMLEKNGFSGFDRIFVSNECNCTKRGDGDLFRMVREQYQGKNIIHVGDDAVADIAAAQKQGFRTIYIPNVNTAGNPYRISGLAPLLNSAYSGIVNMHLHNGLCSYPPAYEYGFIYGGLLVSGFCRWIYDYARNVNADQIWFIARDGFILQRVFQELYPDIKTRYLLWSRTAALKACAKFDKSAWKNFFIFNKASSFEKYTVEEILQDAGIGVLTEHFELKDSWMNTKILPKLEAFIDEKWDKILQIYEKDLDALKNYLNVIRGKAKNIVLVDVGYSGTCPLSLQRFLNTDEVKTHILLGIYGRVKIQPDLLLSPEIHSYLFSENHNVDLWRDYSMDSNGTNSLRLEMFFTAPHAYTNGLHAAENVKYKIVWGHHHQENDKIIREIHQGILDFVRKFHDIFKEYPWLQRISGRDAYLPFAAIKNQNQYFKKNFAEYYFDAMPKDRKTEK